MGTLAKRANAANFPAASALTRKACSGCFSAASTLACAAPRVNELGPVFASRAKAVDDASAAQLEREIFEGYGGDWADFDRGCIEVPELVQRIASRTGLAPADVRRVVDAVPGELQPLPDTVALLRRLSDELVAAGVGFSVYLVGFIASFWLPEPGAEDRE